MLATAIEDQEKGCLKYRLLGSSERVDSFGHPYIRRLCLQIPAEWNAGGRGQATCISLHTASSTYMYMYSFVLCFTICLFTPSFSPITPLFLPPLFFSFPRPSISLLNPASSILSLSLSPADNTDEQLSPLVSSIIQYCLNHNAEEEACDLLMEVEWIDKIVEFVTVETHERVCLYLTR